ncbi:MAG: hypothetical protein FJY75_05880 [Candidatus Eisenbacteria bacterium]|uniref:Aminopeptidase N n=1 Tax=Eiseniibacteriota bacterium TaxID=2212470 RepID=A0A937X7L7_UNCEI|nr:hypothetical protein [Candidatus Eisenbacteria bacterium]
MIARASRLPAGPTARALSCTLLALACLPAYPGPRAAPPPVAPAARSVTGAPGERGAPPFPADQDEGKGAREREATWLTYPEWEPDESGYDALHVTLTLEPLFDSLAVVGEARWRLRIADPAPATIGFDFADNLTILAAQVDGRGVPFTRGHERLELRPAAPLGPGALVDVLIGYRGRPRPAFLQGLAFARHDGAQIVFTNSQPFASRTWWPCKDRPDDKFAADLRFIVPDTMIAAANGRLLAVVPIEGGRRLFHWRAVYPLASYLVSLTATNFAAFADTYVTLSGREVPLAYFAYPEDLARAQADWAFTPRAMRCFEELFGEYPFAAEKYGMAEYPWPGAMEHQTLSSMGAYFFDLLGPQDWVVVHELAHQWWGNWVTCGTWRDIWLNEGFATYAEALWAEWLAGPDSLRQVMRTKRDRYYPGSCYAPDFLFNSTVYRKGAWVLHMLRRVLGDEAFFRALREYGAAHAYGSAVTADFQAACERVWGGGLSWFFDRWVYGTGRPAYGVWWEVLTADGDGPAVTWIRIVQESSGPALFRMPLDARLRLADGSEFCTVLWDSLADQSFLIETPARPLALLIDPDEWVLADVFYGAYPADVAGGADAQGAGAQEPLLLLPPRPNPSRGLVALSWERPAAGGGAFEIGLFDAGGRLVRTLAPLAPAGGGGSFAWDGTDRAGRPLPAGVYFAAARSDGREWSQPRRLVLLR